MDFNTEPLILIWLNAIVSKYEDAAAQDSALWNYSLSNNDYIRLSPLIVH